MKTPEAETSPSEELRPASGRSTVEAVYQALKGDIISGTRHPGELLRIDRMSRTYGVGPTPLRETLQRLTAESLVIARDGRGFQVAPLTIEEFEDLNIARTAVELAALRDSIEHGTDIWESRIVAAGYILEKCDSKMLSDTSPDVDRWEAANSDFHTALLSACRSTWLLRIQQDLASKSDRYRRAAVMSADRNYYENVAREHKELREAALGRDAQTGCRILATHYDRTVRTFARFVRQQTGAQKRG